MTHFAQNQVVRVARLLHALEQYDGWKQNQRPPRVGDTGTIVDVLGAPGVAMEYVVESLDADGATLWLGTFETEELEANASGALADAFPVKES
jgi:hypothetical protein